MVVAARAELAAQAAASSPVRASLRNQDDEWTALILDRVVTSIVPCVCAGGGGGVRECETVFPRTTENPPL